MKNKINSSIVLCSLLSVFLLGCTTTGLNDLFSGYHSQLKATRQAQLNADYIQAINKLPNVGSHHNNYALSMLERARLYYLNDERQKSREHFELAYQVIDAQNKQAKYRISSGLKSVGAVFSNDNILSYNVPTYEQSMLHSYQALNYLYGRNIESALVEVRRANLVQEQALKENQNALNNARNELQNEGVDVSRLYSAYPDMSGVIGAIKNGFQNAFTFYLSGILYEINGDTNDAYIDYKKALEIAPNNTFIQKDVMRLAQMLVMSDELVQLEKDFGKVIIDDFSSKGDVIFLIEQGVIANREDLSINLPVFTRHNDLRFFSFSLPVYRYRNTPTPLKVSTSKLQLQSQNVVKIQSLAAKTLKDELPWLVARQTVRVVAKEEMRRKMSREGGDIGNILASLYNIASEKADTRSWLTLPDNIQVVRAAIALGEHTVSITSGGATTNITLNVQRGMHHIVNVVNIGNKLQTKQIAY